MSLKITTGSHTKIFVANLKTFKEISVAQDLNATESATSTFLSAIGKTRPIYGFKEINDTPVSGNINIYKSDNVDFMRLILGLGDGEDIAGETLGKTKPVYMLLRHFDNNTNAEFQATWLPSVIVNSNQENVPLKGALTSQYSVNASMILKLPRKAIIEILPVTSGSATLSHTPVTFEGKEFLPANVDSDGNYTYFVVDTTTGTILSNGEWSVSGTTLTVPSSISEVMVAYQYEG